MDLKTLNLKRGRGGGLGRGFEMLKHAISEKSSLPAKWL